MKFLKMLGLAAVAAAALMAIAGTGTASATVLCHSTSTPCTEKWKVGTEARFVVSSTGIWTKTSGEPAVECPEGEIRGKVSNAGSETETVKVQVEASGFTWPSTGSCIRTETIEGGTLEIHTNSGTDDGTVTTSGFVITMSILGASCTYTFSEPTTFGTLTANGAGNAVLDINTTFTKKSGSFLCPVSLNWTEKFTQEKPSGTALYVEPS